MNIQEAIDLSVKEDRRVTFSCSDSRELILSSITDQKGCALMKKAKDSNDVTVWPPSQCTVTSDNDILPTCLL